MAGGNRVKSVNLAVQAYNLKKFFPDSICAIKHSCLIWETDLIPSALSKTYKIQIKYKLKKGPDILVLNPKLEIPEGERLPHIYPGKRLCLYYPGIGEWRSDMLLVKAIVPWISEWLLNYEIWLATGIWCGGGKHPPVDEKMQRD